MLSTEHSIRYQSGSRIPSLLWIGEGLGYAAYTARITMSRPSIGTLLQSGVAVPHSPPTHANKDKSRWRDASPRTQLIIEEQSSASLPLEFLSVPLWRNR